MAAHSIFSESLYGHAVLIRSCFSGFIISLFHKRRKGIAIFNIDSHVWISPYTLTSTELHAPSPASPARYAPAESTYTVFCMYIHKSHTGQAAIIDKPRRHSTPKNNIKNFGNSIINLGVCLCLVDNLTQEALKVVTHCDDPQLLR